MLMDFSEINTNELAFIVVAINAVLLDVFMTEIPSTCKLMF